MKVVVAFAGGGTGGHIYPGLAVADSLRKIAKSKNIDIEISWIGCSSGMDRNIVENNLDAEGHKSADFFYGIPAGKLRRYLSFKNLIDVFRVLGGILASFAILLKIKPNVLFSKGGFVSVPPCIAAKVLRIPILTHECDFTPGLATKINSKFAEKILVSYAETVRYFGGALKEKIVLTGNPVRPVFYCAKAKNLFENSDVPQVNTRKPLLVVVGGSSGAAQINNLVLENLEWLCQMYDVVHQTGKNCLAENRQLPENYKAFEFIYGDMPNILAAADVILSRAGANSLWECAVLAKPLVLVPLCGSGTRGDQEDNAAYFAERGAAIVLGRNNATAENLQDALTKMLDEKMRSSYAAACGALAGGVSASEKIANIIFDRLATK